MPLPTLHAAATQRRIRLTKFDAGQTVPADGPGDYVSSGETGDGARYFNFIRSASSSVIGDFQLIQSN
jgi:hypothetical protein